ncbi:glycosyltransferase family 4 protein [Flavobacterium sp. HSC-61S13]|uniref:glycosyltransferase family 4 protein n=1 Tax=Flavobacterium sp. HSC-61S13 TaxID=2910963 RepID=UPI00209E2A90|nr:glycosyltransferase family 4 protein [Flavobacterium sp. HSC-61S13]MCP1997430.1 glycosyltransferase involved in cell wall biosynthesis [Flavobacterium sp. HSC-61S13]
MKVLQVVTSLSTGGAEKLIVDMIPNLQKQGHLTDVLVLKDMESGFRNQLKASTNGRVFFMSKGSVYNPWHIIKIVKYLHRYDVVHVHLFPALYWVVLARFISFSKTRIVYTEHSTNNRRRQSKIWRAVDKVIYRGLDSICCITAATKKNLDQHLGRDTAAKIINNGIVVENYKNKSAKFEYLPQGFNLIQVSSFRSQKDQMTVIKALKYLPEEISVIFVGDGGLRQEHEDFAEKLDLMHRVIFLGNRYDVPELLNFADVAILSSYYEGFGLSIVEGMAAGKPAIASDVEGIKEIVDGYGLLFEQGNEKELADCILQLYTNQQFYAEKAKSCALRAEEYTLDKMINLYIKEYDS